MPRGFEIVTKYADQNINLPARSTKNAAGYDFYAAEDKVIPSIVSSLDKEALQQNPDLINNVKPVLVSTGIKSYMNANEYLQLVVRSSAPIKLHLVMPNAVGIVDADYYNNESNEGEIFFQFLNFGTEDVIIKKGDKIGQGIFLPYLLADNDNDTEKEERIGGFGSTDK